MGLLMRLGAILALLGGICFFGGILVLPIAGYLYGGPAAFELVLPYSLSGFAIFFAAGLIILSVGLIYELIVDF